MMRSEKLFSYGTLRYENVQLSLFGRSLQGESDALIGFILKNIEIKDPQVLATSGEAFHPMLEHTGDIADLVPGMVFDISEQELFQADQYEVADYKRIQVQLSSGVQAWVYVAANT